MRRGSLASLLILLPLLKLEENVCGLVDQTEPKLYRDDFPPNFIFGAGTSAYQVEGAAKEDGRGPSIWDTFTHAGRMPDRSTGDIAADGYRKYKEDVKLMVDTGLESYRFSISWTRLIPNGRGVVNRKGLAFYNNLIDELVKNGIKPHVTLFQFDLPQALDDEYQGWLSSKIVDDFTAYADVCFKAFGDRVKQWTTIVEPNAMAMTSYDKGEFPPNRCSHPFGNCTAGDSTTEPYIVVHNALLAHASAATLYKRKYQAKQNGWIGLNIHGFWAYPFSNSTLDIKASQRSIDFIMGWILNPLVFGDYPTIMKKIVGLRLPSFTKDQSEEVKGSFDFIGLNYYKSKFVKGKSNITMDGPRDFMADMFATITGNENEWPAGESPYAGLQHMLNYLKDAYGNPPAFIEENGYGRLAYDILNDNARVDFLSGSINTMLDALRDNANLKGYFVWSFLDVFEFAYGFQSSFGLYHVDFKDVNRTRTPKLSAIWYSNFLKGKVDVKLNKTSLHARS